MTLPQFPLFLRFNARMLCSVALFTYLFLTAETPFYHSDSVIFISEGSYLFKESESGIYIPFGLSEKESILQKHEDKLKRKALFKKSSSYARKNAENKIESLCFTLPKSSHNIGNPENSLSPAVLGNFSQPKNCHKITGSIFRTFLKTPILKRKLKRLNKEFINLLKITVSHFGRPPPPVSKYK